MVESCKKLVPLVDVPFTAPVVVSLVGEYPTPADGLDHAQGFPELLIPDR